jgi:hypothetical protein
MTVRQVSAPFGSWPLEMRAKTAAAYTDEPSVGAFLAKVHRGIYPRPIAAKGCLPKWHRHKLDHAIAQRHGLLLPNPQVVEDASGLI